jgi:hypothetical protein
VHKHGMKIYADEVLEKGHPKDWKEWGEFEPAGIDDPNLQDLFTESDRYHDDLTSSVRTEALNARQQDILSQMRWALDFLKDGQPKETIGDLNEVIKKSEVFINELKKMPVSDEKLRDVFIAYLQGNMTRLHDEIIPAIGNEKQLHDVIVELEKLLPNYFYSTMGPLVARKIYAKGKGLRVRAQIKTELISEEEKPNYLIRKEIWTNEQDPEYPGTEMRQAYSKDGDYIGDVKDAEYLCDEMGIIPEKSKPSHCVCSIGFCPKEQKWYGWSHRAIHSFGIGDEAIEWFPEGETKSGKIKTLEEAKKAAIAFADSVS